VGLVAPYTGGRNSPVRSSKTSGNFSGSGISQSMQRNFRSPILISINRIGLLHFEHLGGGRFLGMARSRWSGGSTTELSVTDYCRRRDGDDEFITLGNDTCRFGVRLAIKYNPAL
jgi:hypothetical protein